MFYKIIIGDRIQTAIFIILTSLVIWIPAFLSPGIIVDSGIEKSMPFFKLSSNFLSGHILMSKLLSFGLILSEAFVLVRINAKFVLVQQRTLLPALFFIIITGHNPCLLQWNPVLPATLFLIMVLEIIFRSYRDEPNSYRYFEAGILLGLGSLFYAPLAYLLVFTWFAVKVQRPFYWREYIFPFLGLLLPYIFVFAFLYFTDRSLPEFVITLKSNFILDFKLPEYLWIYWTFIGYTALLLALATIYLLKVFQFRKIYIRDYFTVLFWLFITGLIIFIFFSGVNFRIIYLLAVPISYLLTNYFVNAKKSIGNKVLIYLLLGYTLFLAIYNLKGNI